MYKDLKIDSELLKLANEAEKVLEEIYSRYEANSLLNSAKVLSAFQKFMVSGTDFCEITGYGYSDAGRDKL